MLKMIEKHNDRIQYEGSERNPLALYGVAVGEGWYPLVDELADKLAELDDRIMFFQVKEKFGGLRFYTEHLPRLDSSLPADRDVWDRERALMNEYERKAAAICEVCGAEGKLRNELKWKKTLCDEHNGDFVHRQLH